MIIANPPSSDILCNSVTANGTVITIPANRTYTCDMVLVGSGSLGTVTLTFNAKAGSTGVGPASGTVVSRLPLGSTNGNSPISLVCNGGSAGATIDFNTGGAASAAATINGFLV